MAAGVTRIVGLTQFRKELKALEDGKALTRNLAVGMKAVAVKAEGHARSAARSGTRQQAHFADEIRGSGGAAGARLQVDGVIGGKKSGESGAFWGAKKYPQFPQWVGKSYEVAVRGQGPQPLNDSLAQNMPEYENDVLAVMEKSTRAAFPDGRL